MDGTNALSIKCFVEGHEGIVNFFDPARTSSETKVQTTTLTWVPRNQSINQITLDVCQDIQDIFSASKQPKLKIMRINSESGEVQTTKAPCSALVFVFENITSRDNLLNAIVLSKQQSAQVNTTQKSVKFSDTVQVKDEKSTVEAKDDEKDDTRHMSVDLKPAMKQRQKSERRLKRQREIDSRRKRHLDKGWYMHSAELKNMYALLVDGSNKLNMLDTIDEIGELARPQTVMNRVKRERDREPVSSVDDAPVQEHSHASLLLTHDEFATLYEKERADYYAYHSGLSDDVVGNKNPLAVQPTAVPSVYAIVDALTTHRIVDPVTHRLNSITPSAAAAIFCQYPFLEKVYTKKFFSDAHDTGDDERLSLLTAEDELLFWETLVHRTLFFIDSRSNKYTNDKVTADELLVPHGADMRAPPIQQSNKNEDAARNTTSNTLESKLNSGSAQILADYSKDRLKVSVFGSTDRSNDIIDDIKVQRQLQRRVAQNETCEERKSNQPLLTNQEKTLPTPSAVSVLHDILKTQEFLLSTSVLSRHANVASSHSAPEANQTPSCSLSLDQNVANLGLSNRKQLKNISALLSKELRTFYGLTKTFWIKHEQYQNGRDRLTHDRLLELVDATRIVSRRLSSLAQDFHIRIENSVISAASSDVDEAQGKKYVLWTDACVAAMEQACQQHKNDSSY